MDSSGFDEKPYDETGVEPLSKEFNFDRFEQMLDQYPEKNSKGVKGFLVSTGYVTPNHIAGLGNAIVQDILFNAKLSPKRKTMNLETVQRKQLFDSINRTIGKAINLGGRYDEIDLFGNKGGYTRLMDRKTKDTPCIICGSNIIKISYLGGACYLCPECQT